MKKFVFILVLICAPQNVTAHVLDEYLQSAQIALSPTGAHIELHLTPGVDVADRVFASIDRNRNDELSPTEQQAYAERVLRDVTLELDGQRTLLVLDGFHFPSQSAMRQGDSIIQLDLSASLPFNAPADHRLTFFNNHWPQIGVYQANALLPTSDSIKLITQQRDRSQHEFQLHFRIVPPAAPSTSNAIATNMTPTAVVTGSLRFWPFWTGLLLMTLYRTILPT